MVTMNAAPLVLAAAIAAAHPPSEPPAPHLHPGALAAARARALAGDAALQPALSRLKREADEALVLKPPSVMDKTRLPASGDKHDYFSFGPYWWPDPAKPDGLPYIRRDGETNPDSLRGTDTSSLKKANAAFETLALAYHLTGHEPYAQQAVLLLRTWFLDPQTRMNPSLRYAQAIPGVTDGRGIGIIEGRHLLGFIEGQPLVFPSPSWTKEDEKGFRDWLETYDHWLRTSANGVDEADEENNHGTWYDVQSIELALFLGHVDEAKALDARALALRVSTQVEPDGRQPRELARTKPISYSMLNLEGLFLLATLGEHVGVDGWGFKTDDGRSLRGAVEYLASYADPAKETTDLLPVDRSRLLPLFVEAERHIDAARYAELLRRYGTGAAAEERWQLFR
jgi:hypothetical protein